MKVFKKPSDMHRIIFISCLIILFLAGFNCYSEVIDLIIMVDTSTSMYHFFDDLVRYLVTDLIKNYLDTGDTFHLLSFSDKPVFEFALEVTDDISYKAILKEIFFLKEKIFFGRYTDLISAIKYIIEYGEMLPVKNKKEMILLTDGIHDPSPLSPYAGWGIKDVEAELEKYARTIIQKNGWHICILKYPSDRKIKDKNKENRASEKEDAGENEKATRLYNDTYDDNSMYESGDNYDDNTTYLLDDTYDDNSTYVLDVFKDILDTSNAVELVEYDQNMDENDKENLANITTGFPRLNFPGYLGRQGRVITIPFVIENFKDREIFINLESVEYDGESILDGKVKPGKVSPNSSVSYKVKIKLPPDYVKGPAELPIRMIFNDNSGIFPEKGLITFYYTGDIWVDLFNFITSSLNIIIIVFIAVIIMVIIVIFIKMHIFEELFANLLKPSTWGDKKMEAETSSAPMIEMRVSFQNPHIGFRNIHRIEQGKALTLGGGFSSYLIFLIPMPSHIAEIRNDNGTYIFEPVRLEFFPEIKAPLKNCLKKDINVVSKNGYEMSISFIQYESPLLKINKLLNSINYD